MGDAFDLKLSSYFWFFIFVSLCNWNVVGQLLSFRVAIF